VLPVELSNCFRSKNAIGRLPGVGFTAEVLPLDEILQFPPGNATIKNFLYFPLLLSIFNHGGCGRNDLPARNRVFRSRNQLDNIEDRVETGHGTWKAKAIGNG